MSKTDKTKISPIVTGKQNCYKVQRKFKQLDGTGIWSQIKIPDSLRRVPDMLAIIQTPRVFPVTGNSLYKVTILRNKVVWLCVCDWAINTVKILHFREKTNFRCLSSHNANTSKLSTAQQICFVMF